MVALIIVGQMSAPMEKVDQLNALAGKGIEGDRYFLGTGTYSKKPEPSRQVTLVKNEVLESLKDKFNITVKPEKSCRNALTHGVEFTI